MSSIVRLLTFPAELSFARRNVQPPSAYYVTADDLLTVSTRNIHPTTRVELRARLLSARGGLKWLRYVHVPNTDRTLALQTFEMEEGYLLGVLVTPTAGDVRRGQCFASVYLSVGAAGPGVQLHGLLQDYVVSDQITGWPGGVLRHSVEGPGLQRRFTGANPAPGVDWAETVPAGARWKIVGVRVSLQCSAVAGNRFVSMVVNAGGVATVASNSTVAQIANALRTYSFQNQNVDAYETSPGVGPVIHVTWPADVVLSAGDIIQGTVFNRQAGDDFNQPQLWIEEWMAA